MLGSFLALLSLAAAQAPPRAFFTLTEASSYHGYTAKCNITNGGACISDLNYGNDEECTFRAEAIISVSATTFDTEQKYDYITIGGTRYSGTSGPINVVMAAGETIMWHSNEYTTASGFVICASPVPPSPPPSPSLPPSPPVAPIIFPAQGVLVLDGEGCSELPSFGIYVGVVMGVFGSIGINIGQNMQASGLQKLPVEKRTRDEASAVRSTANAMRRRVSVAFNAV